MRPGMAGLRDEITRTLLRFRGVNEKPSSPREIGPVALARPELEAGAELGSYRILKRLGWGGMGHVYLATDSRLGRHVALKLLPPELTSDPVFLLRFQQEAKTASALNHPNILTIYDFVEISGHHILVSEFIEGETLQSALRRRTIDQEKGLDIVAQIASALTAAHAAGVAHRDLKPGNVMIRPDGYVKVIDFGLAKLVQRTRGSHSADRNMTRPGLVLGTIGYLSPEQARCEEVDERTDIWSLGVILYEIVTHQRPFGGDSDSHVLVAILDSSPSPIPDSLKLSPGLSKIIDCALQKDRKKRYQSAEQMLTDLHTLQAGPITSRGITRRVRRNRFSHDWLWVSIAAFLIAGAFCCWWWAMEGRWKVFPPKWFELGSSRRLTFNGDVTQASISPDGRLLAYVSGESNREVLHLLETASRSERQLANVADTYLGLTFSPDSKTLYYVLTDRQQERGRLFSIPVTSFANEPPGLLLEDLDGPVSFSPDGSRFAFFRGRAEGNRSVEEILLGSETNFRDVKPILSLVDTQIGAQLAWSSRKNWLAAITYPRRLNQPTRAIVTLVTPTGQFVDTYLPENLRGVKQPVVLDGGKLILFSGVPQNAEQSHLVQLSVPANRFHEVPSDSIGFESISATSDGKTLASVRVDRRSSIWMADSNNLNAPVKLTPDSESISSLTWSDDGDLIFPSLRTGNVNLVRLDPKDRTVRPVARPQPYVEHQPAFTPNLDLIVYASNRALGGDDFNLWTVNAKTGVSKRLTSGSNYDEEPNVSPDGRSVFYTSWASSLRYIWRVPSQGGTPVQISHTQAWHPSVSPDGTKVACLLKEPNLGLQVTLLSANDGSVLYRFPKIPATTQIQWSPDGTALDYISNDNGSHGIVRQPLAGGQPRQLLRLAEGDVGAFSWNRDGAKLAYIRSREQKDVFLFSRNNSR